ncbi:hypothetical protein AGDE_09817 [Angomonas deanei]|uniref:SET domain containing protein, putative n=1 Tax=Angomonas deanei TaxID=59799 RepID=A0A7G2C681_9TRYP|nr:hypothetical protein AGDE_09817 [Angomonas deanei]CAD2214611.1 SET domain containing protein, putative [Angomonas deanei]|eukprot:EPY29794.1 hypothetical protein AGDE_09817 [Angomonas deanei]
MIVESTAQNVGAKGEFRRLEEMVVEILREVLDEEDPGRREGALDYLHHWILTGQPSSLLEHWPKQSTDRVIAAIGGEAQLLHLELHPIHIARLAAILDLNSFLVESYYANRKGMAYFPEAGYLNHSCEPNCDYEIMPAHVFPESDYYLDEFVERDRRREEGEEKDVVTTEGEKDVVTSYGDTPLTEEDAPRYLFCCRANQDIKSGEQILIAYVPPTWTFDQRQEVLHDRYRFWCKCPKCSPTLDSRYGKGARFLMALLALAIVLQVFMVYTRDKQHDVDKELEQLRRMTPEERREELIRRGFDVDDLTPEGWKKRQASRKGLFEELEDKKLMDLSFENARIDLFPDEMKKELYEMERRKNRY